LFASRFPRSLTPHSAKSHTIAAERFSLPTSTVRIQRKLQMVPGPKFRQTARASHSTPKATRRIAPVLSVTLQSPTSPAAKSRLYQIFRATIVSVLSGRRMENSSLFSIMADNAWQLGLVSVDGSGFRFVKNAELRPEAFGAPEWARDGKSIFCHDLDNIYQIDLDGNVLKKWELSKILTDASMNSGDRLSISPDGNTLLMDVDCGSEHERKNWDGPQPAIEKLDLSADKAVRITGKDDYVCEPFWLTASEFLCIIQKEKKNEASIYRMSLDGKNPKLLVKHARTPSASAP